MAPLKNITIQENLGFESLNCIIFTEITQTYNSNNIAKNWNNNRPGSNGYTRCSSRKDSGTI